jgi:uncharacterized delta-60 repeat protein
MKTLINFLAATLLLSYLPTFCNAQSGTLDNTFNSNGKVITHFGSSYEEVKAIAIQSDGKIIAAGRFFNTTTSVDNIIVARYSSDGSLDNTFDTDGFVLTAIALYSTEAFAVALQTDGKIVVGGYKVQGGPTPTSDFVLIRYNTDGSLDNTFGGDGIVESDFSIEDAVKSIAIQPDGNIIAGGYIRPGENYDFAITRYTSEGILDNTFSDDGFLSLSLGNYYCWIGSIVLQDDSKIVASNVTSGSSMIRLNQDGTFDNTFSDDGIVSIPAGDAMSLALQDDNKLVLAGAIGLDFGIMRCNSDGSIDNTFGTNGSVSTDFGMNRSERANAVVIQADGRITAAGYTKPDFGGNSQFALAQYNPDGSLNSSFGTNGILTTGMVTNVFENSYDAVTVMALQADEKIIVAGYSGLANKDFALARYLNSGTVDVSANDAAGDFVLFPNPAADRIIIAIDTKNNAGSVLNIYNAFGQLLNSEIVRSNQQEINVSDLSSGMYMLELKSAEKTEIQKLIIQK